MVKADNGVSTKGIPGGWTQRFLGIWVDWRETPECYGYTMARPLNIGLQVLGKSSGLEPLRENQMVHSEVVRQELEVNKVLAS